MGFFLIYMGVSGGSSSFKAAWAYRCNVLIRIG
jgi:hypothetical protein